MAKSPDRYPDRVYPVSDLYLMVRLQQLSLGKRTKDVNYLSRSYDPQGLAFDFRHRPGDDKKSILGPDNPFPALDQNLI